MAEKSYTYIYELPFVERKQLCNILDADERWEELAGSYMHLDVTTIILLRRNTSPTWELLERMGQRNLTVNDLFVFFKNMGHHRAMTIIKELVDLKYHYLLNSSTHTARQYLKPSSTKSTATLTSPRSPLPTVPTEDRVVSPEMEKGASGGRTFKSTCDPVNIQHTNQSKVKSYNKYGASSSKSQISTDKLLCEDRWNAEKSHSPPSGYFPMKGEDICISFDGNTSPDHLNQNDNGASQPPVFTFEDKILNERKTSLLPTNVQQSLKSNDSRVRKSSREIESALHATTNIVYKEILDATNNFDSSKLLGSGGFGEVYHGNWKNTQVAIKRLRPKKLRSENVNKANNNESIGEISVNQSFIELLSLNNYRHDNILPLYGISIGGPDPCLVYQFMLNGSLEDRLLCRRNTSPLPWFYRSSISRGTARGLQFLHTSGKAPLIHGDIKSANVLLDSNFVPKIGDFGLARDGPTGHYTHIEVSALYGTQYYLPEEYLRNRQLSTKVDTYSFGIVLFEIATGLRSYEGKRSNRKPLLDVVYEEQNNMSKLRDEKAGEKYSDWFFQLIELGKECTNSSKRKRPEMVQVLQTLELTWRDEEAKEEARRMCRHGQSLPNDHNLLPVAIQAYHDEKKKMSLLQTSQSNAMYPSAPGFLSNDLKSKPGSSRDETLSSMASSCNISGSDSNRTNNTADYYNKNDSYYPLLTCLGLKNRAPDEELTNETPVNETSSVSSPHKEK